MDKGNTKAMHTEAVLCDMTCMYKILKRQMTNGWPSQVGHFLERLEDRVYHEDDSKVIAFERDAAWKAVDIIRKHHGDDVVTSAYRITDEIERFRRQVATGNVPDKRQLTRRSPCYRGMMKHYSPVNIVVWILVLVCGLAWVGFLVLLGSLII